MNLKTLFAKNKKPIVTLTLEDYFELVGKAERVDAAELKVVQLQLLLTAERNSFRKQVEALKVI